MQELTIGIVGGGWTNKGAEAMTYTVIRELQKRLGENCRFLVFLLRRDGVPSTLSATQHIEIVNDQTGKFQFLSEMFFVFLYALTGVKCKRFHSDGLHGLHACDAIVDIHGYYLHDGNSLKAIGFSLSRLLMTKMLRKAYYVFPQSFGPLNEKKRSFLAASILPLADKICVRGHESKIHLASVMKKHADRIEIVPDTALLFSGEFTAERVEELFEREDIPRDRKLCAISPNTRILRWNSTYSALLSELIEWIVSEFEYTVLLIPHEVKEEGLKEAEKYDDADLCRDIHMALSSEACAEHVHIISGRNYSAKDYKTFVSQCSVLITSRYHMAIAALSLNIPTITLGWSFKYHELMALFGMEDFALDGLEQKALYSMVKQTFCVLGDQHHEIRQRLQGRNKQHQIMVENFFEGIAAHILSECNKYPRENPSNKPL